MKPLFEHYDELIEISEFVPLEDMLKHGLDPTQPDLSGFYVLDPVCYALKYDLALGLIEAGANVNSKSSDGFTPVLSAIECSHHDPVAAIKLVSLLLDRGADIEGRGEWDKTPFLKSCTRGVIGLTRLLVDRGCDIHATANEIGGPMGAVEFADMPSNDKEFRNYVSSLYAA